MASSSISHKCNANGRCKKMGMIKCDGCTCRFCPEHFASHRQELDARWGKLCADRDGFYHEITHMSWDPTESVSEIDRWERETLVLVQQTADEARRRVREVAAVRTASSNEHLVDLSNELKRRKESDDYFEQDIERLEQQLERIKTEFSRMINIRLVPRPIDWSTVLHMEVEHFLGGSLLSDEHQTKLNEFYGKSGQKWYLIYKGTRDGFSSTDFARQCAEQGPTMTVIQSTTTHLFGGYTSKSWQRIISPEQDQTDPTAFLFTLTNPQRIRPTKYSVQSPGTHAIRSVEDYGPIFGESDLRIQSNRGSVGFPVNYLDTTGKGQRTFTGASNFQLSEIEVYRKA